MTWAKRAPIYELRVDLADVQPPIWRTFRIPSEAALGDLHVVLQTVMGWTNSHLHEFRAGSRRFAEPNPYGNDYGPRAKDEANFAISDVLKKPKQKLAYLYDFGDSWEHVVTLVAIHPGGPDLECLDGERACPPEDCGGTHGYERLLTILADRKHPEYADTKTWLKSMTPGGHDQTAFNRAGVNALLAGGLEGLLDRYIDLLSGRASEDKETHNETHDEKVIQFPLPSSPSFVLTDDEHDFLAGVIGPCHGSRMEDLLEQATVVSGGRRIDGTDEDFHTLIYVVSIEIYAYCQIENERAEKPRRTPEPGGTVEQLLKINDKLEAYLS